MKYDLNKLNELIQKGFTKSESEQILEYKSRNVAFEELSSEEKINYIITSEEFMKYGDIYAKSLNMTRDEYIEHIKHQT